MSLLSISAKFKNAKYPINFNPWENEYSECSTWLKYALINST